mmetsp:Transcript_45996/g.51442  ORF Transcript_45996/g.51442 Transcript_45996/m.51442 type:complete len:90 (+) Transcript_45996:327-596(+)
MCDVTPPIFLRTISNKITNNSILRYTCSFCCSFCTAAVSVSLGLIFIDYDDYNDDDDNDDDTGNIFVHDGSPRNCDGKFNGNEYCLSTI